MTRSSVFRLAVLVLGLVRVGWCEPLTPMALEQLRNTRHELVQRRDVLRELRALASKSDASRDATLDGCRAALELDRKLAAAIGAAAGSDPQVETGLVDELTRELSAVDVLVDVALRRYAQAVGDSPAPGLVTQQRADAWFDLTGAWAAFLATRRRLQATVLPGPEMSSEVQEVRARWAAVFAAAERHGLSNTGSRWLLDVTDLTQGPGPGEVSVEGTVRELAGYRSWARRLRIYTGLLEGGREGAGATPGQAAVSLLAVSGRP